MAILKELSNYVADGAFGKQGEAFSFHSSAGAVPVLLPHRVGSNKFRLGPGLAFDCDAALTEIAQFISILWSGNRSPAQKYLQESGLPIILTMAADGAYANAMRSDQEMDVLLLSILAIELTGGQYGLGDHSLHKVCRDPPRRDRNPPFSMSDEQLPITPFHVNLQCLSFGITWREGES